MNPRTNSICDPATLDAIKYAMHYVLIDTPKSF